MANIKEKESPVKKLAEAKSIEEEKVSRDSISEKKEEQLKDSFSTSQGQMQSVPVENQLFSEKCALFKKEGDAWTEKSTGIAIGKKIENKGAQLIFAMENTRIILNALIAKKAGVKRSSKNVIFAALDEGKPGIFCLGFASEDLAEKVAESIKSACTS